MKRQNILIYFIFSPLLISQPNYEFEIIQLPNLQLPLDMNHDGTVIVGTDFSGQAIMWTEDEGEQVLGAGEAWGVSEDGRIFAEMINSNGNREAAIIENGEITFLGICFQSLYRGGGHNTQTQLRTREQMPEARRHTNE